MSKGNAKKLGDRGEDLAVHFLEKKHYQILERNYRFARGEIDIIAKEKDTLIFVEVKTAQNDAFGTPESWVNKRKQTQIGQVAHQYLQEKEIVDVDCRFDVIAIVADGKQWRVRHIENAFWL